MALDDIVNYIGEPVVLEVSRGNIGTLIDITSGQQVEIEIPTQLTEDPDYVYIS